MKLLPLLALFAVSMPLTAAPAPVPLEVSYVTFNIGGGAASKYGFRQPFDLPRAGAFLKGLDADFVALQEVDRNVGRNGNPRRDTAADLARAAGFPTALYGKTIPLKGGEYGIALLSKTPPETWETVRLPGDGEARVFIDARYRMADGKTLAVCATHLGLSSEERLAQTRAILDHYKTKPADRLLLAGDLNAEYGSPELNALAKTLRHVSPESEKCTWLGGGKAIDHVFARALPGEVWKPLPPSRRLVYGDQAPLSDHIPVLVRVSVVPAAP